MARAVFAALGDGQGTRAQAAIRPEEALARLDSLYDSDFTTA